MLAASFYVYRELQLNQLHLISLLTMEWIMDVIFYI
jgi:hypothetical protein